jgi:hypothetical protein
VNQTIVFNPARQPKAITSVDYIHTDYSRLASDEEHIVAIPRRVRRDSQVTLDALANRQPFMQNAIETTAAQILGPASGWLRGANPCNMNRPLERKPQALAPLALCAAVLAGASRTGEGARR